MSNHTWVRIPHPPPKTKGSPKDCLLFLTEAYGQEVTSRTPVKRTITANEMRSCPDRREDGFESHAIASNIANKGVVRLPFVFGRSVWARSHFKNACKAYDYRKQNAFLSRPQGGWVRIPRDRIPYSKQGSSGTAFCF